MANFGPTEILQTLLMMLLTAFEAIVCPGVG